MLDGTRYQIAVLSSELPVKEQILAVFDLIKSANVNVKLILLIVILYHIVHYITTYITEYRARRDRARRRWKWAATRVKAQIKAAAERRRKGPTTLYREIQLRSGARVSIPQDGSYMRGTIENGDYRRRR
jgi:hypothetical protein